MPGGNGQPHNAGRVLILVPRWMYSNALNVAQS
jgi:hypothetical protein